MLRRQFLARAAIGSAILAAPLKVAAQAAPSARDRAILDIARAQVARTGNALSQRYVAGIADFGLHSSFASFHLANLESGTVRSLLVTHGSGSDPEHDGWLKAYSNVPGSHASSRGAYVTREWYVGRHGTSVRLGGLDHTNDQAFPRAIVMHAADYATSSHVGRWGRLGRSNGCFAVAPDVLGEVLASLWGGRLLFADSLATGEDGQRLSMAQQDRVVFG